MSAKQEGKKPPRPTLDWLCNFSKEEKRKKNSEDDKGSCVLRLSLFWAKFLFLFCSNLAVLFGDVPWPPERVYRYVTLLVVGNYDSPIWNYHVLLYIHHGIPRSVFWPDSLSFVVGERKVLNKRQEGRKCNLKCGAGVAARTVSYSISNSNVPGLSGNGLRLDGK